MVEGGLSMYRVLIVDDEALIRQGIIAKLKYNRFQCEEILEAEDGEEAIAIIKAQQPQIVITDIRMATINGIELIQIGKEICPRTRFIIVSGYAEFSYAEQAINMGVDGYLLKPIGNDAFVKTIAKVYGQLDKDKVAHHIHHENRVLEEHCINLTLEQKINTLIHSQKNHDDHGMMKPLFQHEKSYYYMLAILNIDGKSYYQSSFSYQDIDVLKFSVVNICDDIACECKKEIIHNLKDRNQTLILCYHKSPHTLKHAVDKFLMDVYSKITKILSISLTIGISAVGDTVNSSLYEQARETLNTRLLYGENKIYKYENQSNKAKIALPLNDLNLLQKSIERYDLSSIKIVLQDIFSRRYMKDHTSTYIRMVWFEITNLLIKICNDLSMDTVSLFNRLLLTEDIVNQFENIDELVAYLYSTILKIFDYGTIKDLDYKSRMTLCIQYLEQHYPEQIAVNDLAARFHMTSSYFSTLFKKETGKTVVKYLTQLRINQACNLLRETAHSVVDIAHMVGFEDPQYFFRVFKKVKDVTPLDYRNKKQWIS